MIPFSKFDGFKPDGTRRLHKGGDDGSDQARWDEEQRQLKVQSAVNAINSKFADPNRSAMYADLSDANKTVATRDLDKQHTVASRDNLFGLARSGLLGGSVDAEAGGDLLQRYGEGKIRAQQVGAAAGADMRSVDEKTRQNLIGLAQSGMDTGTAASMASNQMSAAADTARANSGQATVGRLFDDMGQAYLQGSAMRGRYPNGAPPPQEGAGMFGNLFSGTRSNGRVQP